MRKKIISIIMVIAMLVTILPCYVQASAEQKFGMRRAAWDYQKLRYVVEDPEQALWTEVEDKAATEIVAGFFFQDESGKEIPVYADEIESSDTSVVEVEDASTALSHKADEGLAVMRLKDAGNATLNYTYNGETYSMNIKVSMPYAAYYTQPIASMEYYAESFEATDVNDTIYIVAGDGLILNDVRLGADFDEVADVVEITATYAKVQITGIPSKGGAYSYGAEYSVATADGTWTWDGWIDLNLNYGQALSYREGEWVHNETGPSEVVENPEYVLNDTIDSIVGSGITGFFKVIVDGQEISVLPSELISSDEDIVRISECENNPAAAQIEMVGNGTAYISCEYGGLTYKMQIDVELPYVGFYTTTEPIAENWIGEFDVTDQNNTIYLVSGYGETFTNINLIDEFAEIAEVISINGDYAEIKITGIPISGRYYSVECELEDEYGVTTYGADIVLNNGNASLVFHWEDSESVFDSMVTLVGADSGACFYYVKDEEKIAVLATELESTNEDVVRIIVNEENPYVAYLEFVNLGKAEIKYCYGDEIFSLPVDVGVPYIGFFTGPEVTEDNFITEFTVTEENDTVYFIMSEPGLTLKYVELDEEFDEIADIIEVNYEEGYAKIQITGIPNSDTLYGLNAKIYSDRLAGTAWLQEQELRIKKEKEVLASGTCGTDLTWTLYEDGLMHITGTGEMSNYTKKAPAPWDGKKDLITSVKIESGVTSIGHYSFYRCESLESIEIPDSVQVVGQFAFYQCSKVNNIVIPEGVKNIRQYTFYGCKGLRNLTLPSTIGYIDPYAFGECKFADFVIPEGVKTIYEYAFYMANWDSLVLPESLVNMGQYIFSNAAGIRDIVSTPVNVKTIPAGAYAMCGNMTGIKIADGVTTIGNNAFRYCSFKEIWIPESVTSISSNAFYGMNPENVTMYGTAGSYAETYANEYGFVFVEMNSPVVFEIVTQPTNQTIKVGENAVFSVEATGEELTYQWQYSTTGKTWYESGMDGHGTSQLTVPALVKRNGQMYRCVITDVNGEQLLTDEVVLTVEEPVKLEIMKQPEDKTASKGDVVVFSVDAVGEELTYQWQYSNNEGKYWYNSGMAGSTTSELSVEVTAKRDGQMYRCVVTDVNKNTVTSGTAILRMAAEELVIVTQPESQTVSEGTTVQFVVDATGEGLIYQWQYSNNDGKYWYNSGMDGNKTDTLTVEALKKRDGQVYRCVIKDANGNKLISDTVKLSLEEAGIVIVTQPEDITASQGEKVVFTIEAQGEELTYQWQYSNNSGKYWFNSGMEGSRTNALTVEALSKRDGQMYRCVITNVNGNTMTSDAGILIINK